RAWLWGEDILSSVAEASWIGIGASGIVWRGSLLGGAKAPWPDVIPADRRTSSPEALLGDLPNLGQPPPLTERSNHRPTLIPFPARLLVEDTPVGLGQLQAGLIIAHGALRMWYPYFDVVGDRIDERLAETLGSASQSVVTRPAAVNLLRRFGDAIQDGHNFVRDYHPAPVGYLGVRLENVDGLPVVRRSGTASINPGDTLIAIGGTPVEQLYATQYARTSAATDGYRFELATTHVLELAGPTNVQVSTPSGGANVVAVQPQSLSPTQSLGYAPSLRPGGPLNDLGAPNLYYINLAADVLTDITVFRSQLSAAANSSGLVLDMRGYPGVSPYEVAQRLVTSELLSPIFRTRTFDGF